MSWWNRLSKRTKEPEYKPIQWEFIKDQRGLLVHLFQGQDNIPISLPLNMTVAEIRHQPNVETLELLESMWYEELLKETDDGYLLPYDLLIEAPPEVREQFELPETTSLELGLGHVGIIGGSNFKFILEKHWGNRKHIERTARQIGPWIRLPDRTWLLMEPEQYQFEQLVNEQPIVLDKDQIFAYVAKIRSQARKLNIPMDDYLSKQDFKFANDVDIDLKYDSDQIELIPKYRSSDPIPQEILDEMGGTGSRYYSHPVHGKIFVSTDVVTKSNEIRKQDPIRGQDIPRFAENPEAFLPEIEGLDLSMFGERVKSLGIRVYKAQPYVHANDSGRGWFELHAGVHIIDSEGEVSQTFDASGLEEVFTEATTNGEEYVEHNGEWIRVPHNISVFQEAVTQLEQAWGDNARVDVTKLPYVLEIFENISQLEYNQPILTVHEEMLNNGILDRKPPASFGASLKPFQEEGYVWMKSLHYRKLGGLLADDMGLGKTIQVVSFLTYLHEMGKLTPTLIVVPKSLIENWVAEIHKFASPIAHLIHVHSGGNRVKNPEILQKYAITLTTYQTLVRDQLAFGQVEWQTIICDEAQAIKNPTTAASKVIKAMNAKFRVAMTGTPVENGLSELWSIMDYVQPGLLGSLHEFKKEFMDKLEAEERDHETEQRLLARISMVYKRRTKSEELAGQLPAKLSVEIPVPLGSEQQQAYAAVISQVKMKTLSGLQAIQQLRELCSHPALVNESYRNLPIQSVPKLAKTLDLIREIQAKGEKVLIFTELRQMQEILRDAIRDQFNINPQIINGMTERRQSYVDQFNNRPGFDVMILSPKAAGTGLTITSANHVIHYTRWWNPAVENQATDRVYRIGQNKPVQVYYPIVTAEKSFLTSGTVEEIVHRILTEKQELASSIIVSSRKLEIENEVLESVFR